MPKRTELIRKGFRATKRSTDLVILNHGQMTRTTSGQLPKLPQSVNINVALFSYTRAFGDGPRNFEPWSSDVDDT
ncbi:hypothetical protein TNCV_2524601 [Trichonephila clavipes]|nr:hypothetical protein TNCV_2524601 [Trichonephila clavipes]